MDAPRLLIHLMRAALLAYVAWRLAFILRGRTWQRAEISGEPSTDKPYVAFDLAALLASFLLLDPLLEWVGFRELGTDWAHALFLSLFVLHETAHCCLLYRFLPVHAVIHFEESLAILLLVLYGLYDETTWKTALYAGGIAWAIGVLWEYGENIGTEFWDTQAQHGNDDLAIDLAADALGIVSGLGLAAVAFI